MEPSPQNHRLKAGLLLASAFALTALWTRRTAKNAEQRFPPVGKFIEVEGIRLHCIEHGSGPTVLLLHGNGSQATDFLGCGLIEALGSRYRVIAIDRPGFGYSERPRDRLWTPSAQAALLRKACETLGAREPIVLGHSFGTLVALAFALDNPGLVRGLVLVSGYYFPTARLDALLLSPPAIPVLGDAMRYTVSPLLGRLLMQRMLRRVFSPKQIDPRFSQFVPSSMMLRPWQLKAGAEDSAFMIPAAAELARRYHDISQPVEILAGADDQLITPGKQSVRLSETVSHSRLHLIPAEGHMLHYGQSGEIEKAVERIATADGRSIESATVQRVANQDTASEALTTLKSSAAR